MISNHALKISPINPSSPSPLICQIPENSSLVLVLSQKLRQRRIILITKPTIKLPLTMIIMDEPKNAIKK